MYVALQNYSTVSFVGVIVVSSAKDCGFDARTVKTKDYTCIYDNGICFICAKETALRSKSNEWSSRTEGPVIIIALNVSNPYTYNYTKFRFWGFSCDDFL